MMNYQKHNKHRNYPKGIPLVSSKGKSKCRKVKAVLRYY